MLHARGYVGKAPREMPQFGGLKQTECKVSDWIHCRAPLKAGEFVVSRGTVRKGAAPWRDARLAALVRGSPRRNHTAPCFCPVQRSPCSAGTFFSPRLSCVKSPSHEGV
ncbi:hypothetical protein L798_12072 [Zootermopsis nevadensis]|uniref:Uncharacterized protein n=1 Tax=Zootermopsis nevadensis TaxID=136037 RepID=A0A067R6B6_ZOONE|nr:hypothetical protein L798_12072 [Zootermopsis nevadensis]